MPLEMDYMWYWTLGLYYRFGMSLDMNRTTLGFGGHMNNMEAVESVEGVDSKG